MPNPYVNKVVVNGVPKIDLTGDTVTPSDVLAGKTAHDASGAAITGTMKERGTYSNVIRTKTQSASIPAGHYNGGSVTIASEQQNLIIPSNIRSGVTLLGVQGNMVGVTLNIVAYASTFPATAEKNTIGIISSTTPNGYVISNSIPTENLTNGLVWIKTGTLSITQIPLVLNGNIYIYPVAAEQYVDGAWVSVDGKAYQNGEWKTWIKYLYNTGDLCGLTWENGTSNLQFLQGSIHARGASTAARACTYERIDLTDYRTLRIDYAFTEAADKKTIGFNISHNLQASVPDAAYVTLSPSQTTISCDISALEGYYFLKIYGNVGGVYDIYRIWLEG